MAAKRITIKEVARAAQVSISAVSLALRNKRKISAPERRRIQQIAVELGYAPDPVVTRYMSYLRGARRRVPSAPLAFVIPGYPRTPDRKIADMIRGAREQAARHGYALTEFWPQSPPKYTPAALRRVLRARHRRAAHRADAPRRRCLCLRLRRLLGRRAGLFDAQS